MKNIIFIILAIQLCACSTSQEYESDIFPEGNWYPINPEHFGKNEAKRLVEGIVKP